MVTAETALALPALIVVLGALLTVILAVTTQLRCVAAAREGARAAARGEDASVVRQIASRAAPDGARVTIAFGSDTVTVTVTGRVSPLGIQIGEITVSGTATAQREPSEDGGGLAVGAAALASLLGRRPARSPTRQLTERGSGTLYVASMIGVLAALVAGAALVGKAHVAHGRAAAAADLAALAAAQALLDGSADPCGQAASIAVRNSARVISCHIDGETVLVTAAVPVRLGSWGLLDATANARAGPVDDVPDGS